jgi:hypothetical protein
MRVVTRTRRIMHRSFAAWVSDRFWRTGLFSAIFGALSPQGLSPIAVAAGALPVLTTMRQDARAGLKVALTGSVVIVATLIGMGQSPGFAALGAASVMLAPWALAVVLKRTGSLNLCFQIAVLVSALVLCGLYALLADPVGYWQELMREAARAVTETGLVDEAAFLKSLSVTNWGTYVSLWLLTVLGALFLGRWWQSLLEAPGEFGVEYQQLWLGKLLGALALVVVIAMLLPAAWRAKLPLLSALAWPAMLALALQGLAAVHKLKAVGRIGRGWLIAVYVLLFVPLSMSVTVIALAGWGLADNWQRTRANSAG